MSEKSPSIPYPSDCEVREGLRTIARNKEESSVDKRLVAKAEKIRLLLLDVDGVLTNGILLFSSESEEYKGFNTQDGFGIRLLQEAGIDVGVITARKSAAVSKRCENLKMRYVYQGKSDKLSAFQEISSKSGLKPFEIAYMGDDWLDLVLLNRVGLSVSPANGVEEVRDTVHYVTSRNGGEGAVREVCDLILKSKGLHQKMLQSYQNR